MSKRPIYMQWDAERECYIGKSVTYGLIAVQPSVVFEVYSIWWRWYTMAGLDLTPNEANMYARRQALTANYYTLNRRRPFTVLEPKLPAASLPWLSPSGEWRGENDTTNPHSI